MDERRNVRIREQSFLRHPREISRAVTIRLQLFLVAAALITFAVASHSHASQLSLNTDAPPGSPLVVSPGVRSAPLTLSIFDNSAPNDPANLLTAWQTTLQIVPDVDSVGTVAFDATATPSQYVFSTTGSAGIEALIQSNSTTGDTLVAFDFNFPFTGGVQVPAQPASLLTLDFVASSDAAGLFGVFALNDSRQTIWTDAGQPISLARDFINVPAEMAPVRVGEILVQPEVRILEAGDADRDFDFDQLDLVQVLRARKYLTGEPATWGEGDWDGAPGGSQQNPPSGDGQFDQLDLIAALRAQIYLSGPYAASSASTVEDRGTIQYSAVSELMAGATGSSLDMMASEVFATSDAGGGLDVVAAGSILNNRSLGVPSLQSKALSAIAGTLAPSDGSDAVNALLIPEPPSLILLVGLNAIAWAIYRRRTG